MKIFVAVVLFCSTVLGDPGIKGGLSRKGLNFCSKVLGTFCKQEFEKGNVHFMKNYHFSAGGMEGELLNVEVRDISFQPPNTETIPGEGLTTSVMNFSLTSEIRVERVKYKGEPLKNLSNFLVRIQEATVTLTTKLSNCDGRPEFEVLSCKAEIGEIQPYFGINAHKILLSHSVKNYVRNNDGVLCHHIKQTTEAFMERKHHSLLLRTDVLGFHFDYSLDLNFTTGEDSIEWFQKSSFEHDKHPAANSIDMRPMKLPHQKMFGLSISESVLNRYLSVLYGGDNLTFSGKVTVLNREIAPTLGLQIEEGEAVQITVNVLKTPRATITSKGIVVQANGTVKVLSKQAETLLLFSTLAVHDVGISSDFCKVQLQVQDISLKLTNPYKPEVDFGAFEDILQPKRLNLYKLKGEFKIPLMTGLSLENVSLDLEPPWVTASSDLAVDDKFFD